MTFSARAMGETDPRTFFREAGVPHAEALAALVKPSLILAPTAQAEASRLAGRTRLGGAPDLAAGRAWPRAEDGTPLLFVAQIDLSALEGTRVAGELPSDGIVGFFYAPHVRGGPQGSLPPEFAITWTDAASAVRAAAVDGASMLPEFGVTLAPWWSIPRAGKESPHLHTLALSDEDHARWSEFVGEWDAAERNVEGHRLFGYAGDTEAYLSAALDTDDALRARFFARPVRDRALAPYEDPALAARAKAFRHLLTAHDSEALGVTWGDGAPTSFLVHASLTKPDVESPTLLATASCFAT